MSWMSDYDATLGAMSTGVSEWEKFLAKFYPGNPDIDKVWAMFQAEQKAKKKPRKSKRRKPESHD